MKKFAAGLALAVLATAAGTASAEAGCLIVSRSTDNVIVDNQCVGLDLARQRTIYIPTVIQRVVARSFGIGPEQIEAAALDAIVSGDARQHLSPSGLSIVATADEAAAPVVARNWNLWVDGRYFHSNYAPPADSSEGPTWSGLAGLDYKITPKLTAGLLLSADKTDLDGVLADYSSRSAGAGAYVGYVITDNIVFSGNVLRSWVDSEQKGGFGRLDFETDRWQASAAVNGYWYSGTWRLNPALTVAWSKEFENERNGLTADRTIETGVLTPSLQIGKTFRLSDNVTAEPWGGAYYDWTFLSDTHTSGGGTKSTPDSDLRLQAGLNFAFGSNAQLALTGEIAGLLEDNLNTYALEANLSIQF